MVTRPASPAPTPSSPADSADIHAATTGAKSPDTRVQSRRALTAGSSEITRVLAPRGPERSTGKAYPRNRVRPHSRGSSVRDCVITDACSIEYGFGDL